MSSDSARSKVWWCRLSSLSSARMMASAVLASRSKSSGHRRQRCCSAVDHPGEYRLRDSPRGRIGAASGLGHVAGKIAHTLERGSQTHGGNDHCRRSAAPRFCLASTPDALVNQAEDSSIDFRCRRQSVCGAASNSAGLLCSVLAILRHTVEMSLGPPLIVLVLR